MAKAISFINYKGGVGKTTTTYHVGCSLAQHFNKRVLLIDIDPQTNLTFLCAPYDKWVQFRKTNGTVATLYQRYLDKKALDVSKHIWHTPIEYRISGHTQRIQNIDLIPCDIDLLGEDLGGGHITGNFPSLKAMKEQAGLYLRERTFLKKVVGDIADRYDYILIDCPPNIYLMTQNALVASGWYVITAIPDHLSTIGLTILDDKVKRIKQHIEDADTFAGKPKGSTGMSVFGGIIFVKVRIGGSMITNTHADRMTRVAAAFGKGSCYQTYTTELIGFSEAAENYLPIWMQSSPNAKRAADKREYELITKEFASRY